MSIAEGRPPLTAISIRVVVVCAIAWIVVGLFGHEPYKPDEAYTVGLVKSIVDSGDWLVPRLVGEPFMEKPPLFFATAALFAKALPALPLHEAARFAVVLFVGLALVCIAAAGRAGLGPGGGRLAALMTLATLGTVVRLHQIITDTAQFAGIAMALYGLMCAPHDARRGGLLLGFGAAIAFLSKGLLGPGVIACTALALLAFADTRGATVARAYAIGAAIAIGVAACWVVPLAIVAPDQLRVWFVDNNLGRFLGTNQLGPKKDLLFYVRLLPWYTLPCGPLALWGFAVDRRALRDPALRPALLMVAIGFAVLSLASDGRELYALILVPAVALLGAFGLSKLPLRAERALALGFAVLALLVSAGLFGVWITAMRAPEFTARLPQAVALPRMVAPPIASLVAYAVAVLGVLALWVCAARARRGALPLVMASGLALVWAAIVWPWSAYLDRLKGYEALARDLTRHLPTANCVASRRLGEGEMALLDYFIGLRTRRVETDPSAPTCALLLVQSRPDEAMQIAPRWQLQWQGERGGEGYDGSSLRLYAASAPR